VIAALDGHDFADARDMHDAVEDALYAAGFECKREFEVKLSEERTGFIDLVAWQPGEPKIGLELDMLTPRRKSIRKLFRLPDAIRVVLLRTAAKGRIATTSSLDMVYGLGCTARESYPEEFVRLWNVYPRKDGKGAAFRAWKAQRPPEMAVVSALGWQRKTNQWTSEGGRYIPHLATYLNQRRWEDEPTSSSRPTAVDLRCRFHRLPGTRGKLPDRTPPLEGCPECRHAKAANGSRQGEPQRIDDALPAWMERKVIPATPDEISALREERKAAGG